MRFRNLGYGYGAKSSARSIAVSISPELLAHVDELSGGSGHRSNWVERWLWLAVGLQTGDKAVLEEWETWVKENLDDGDRYTLQRRIDDVLVGYA